MIAPSAIQQRDPRAGAALVMVLMLMAVVGTLGIGYWRQLHYSLAAVRLSAKEASALALADAGIARAVAELRAGHTDFTGVADQPLGQGRYRVALQRETDGAIQIEAEGSLGEAHDPLHRQQRHARWHDGVLSYLPEAR